MDPKKKSQSHWGGVSSEDLERGEYKHEVEQDGFGEGTDLGMGAPDEKKKEPEKKS